MSALDLVTLALVVAVIGASALVGDATLPRRALAVCAVMLGTTALVSALLRAVPGDPADSILGDQAPADARLALDRELGVVDEAGHPLGALPQIARFVRGSASALVLAVAPASWEPELAPRLASEPRSFRTREPVRLVIARRLGNTAVLALAAFVIAALLGIGLGVVAAARRGRFMAGAAEAITLLGVAVPRFFLAPVLVLLFSIQLHWLPPSGADAGLRSLVLPALSLGTALAALIARMTRSSLDSVLASDLVRTARAKGLSEPAVVAKHALLNALPPVITVMGLQVGGLFAGAVVTEKVFAWPGIGLLLVESIQRLDVPVVQGIVLVTALGTALATLSADAIIRALDPRVRRRA
ncbi:MAG TPA: ABC transporter permease [Myxococcota bacterium]|jgi:peptide/nickel transport system permease protein